jgi:predicted DNA-binding WGR domain protein
MQDDERSPIQHHLVLHRIEPEQGIRRFYSLMIERDLFGTVRLVRHWSRIGTVGQEEAEEFNSEDEAGKALETLAQAKRRQGYRDL